ncbi:hypothetical protein NECAME_09767 [Necator americanus]|uniref:Mariner Mos1 transposase n=1 Tax=Necator americanus TaxID=51031 RepID=W2TCI5_NECAM|nr:hypothetical protein NECAME_09767 [Necator americanus]ETN79558.1 hypothetical protein NECAME_09767 [Necator americanus]
MWCQSIDVGDKSDKKRKARSVKLKDAEVEPLLDQDSCQTQEKLAETLELTQQAISNLLKAIGMVQKQESWIPSELKPREMNRGPKVNPR